MPESFHIIKRQGKPVIQGRPMFEEWFRKYPEDTVFNAVFTRKGNSRSGNQNRYYWGVIVESFRHGAKEEWGEFLSKQDAHETLKANCLFQEKVNETTGEIIRIIGSTTENDTWDQEEYHDKCRNLIQEFFGITVPLPGEQMEIF